MHLRARRLAVAHPERLAVRDGATSLDNATLWARVDALAERLVAMTGNVREVAGRLQSLLGGKPEEEEALALPAK